VPQTQNAENASRLNRLGGLRRVDKLIPPHAISREAALVTGVAIFFQ
jgi:hypothetical protein